MTCALYSDNHIMQTFKIGGVTDESYYTALLGYPPTIITSDQVVKNFANESITLKIGVKYTKEYDRNIEKEILKLLEANVNAKDFSWDSKIEEADEIKNAQGDMPQIGMGVTYVIYQSMNYRKVPFSIPLLAILVAAVVSFLVCIVVPAVTWLILEKNGSLVQRIKGIE